MAIVVSAKARLLLDTLPYNRTIDLCRHMVSGLNGLEDREHAAAELQRKGLIVFDEHMLDVVRLEVNADVQTPGFSSSGPARS